MRMREQRPRSKPKVAGTGGTATEAMASSSARRSAARMALVSFASSSPSPLRGTMA